MREACHVLCATVQPTNLVAACISALVLIGRLVNGYLGNRRLPLCNLGCVGSMLQLALEAAARLRPSVSCELPTREAASESQPRRIFSC